MMQSFMQLSPDSVNVGRRQIESKNAIVKYMGDQLSQLGWLGDIWAFDKHSSRQTTENCPLGCFGVCIELWKCSIQI